MVIPVHKNSPSKEMKAAVEEAGKFGLKVAAHAHSAAGIKEAVRLGVASIEHGTHLDDEGIALMKEHGTYLVADIYNDEYIQGEGKKRGMPKDFLEHDQISAGFKERIFRKAVRAGVKMAFGTDAGVFPHGQNARQFAWMVKYGMTPLQAVQSATIDAARLLGQDAELGSLTAGKRADIMAVEGDPMADVSLLEKVDFVMKDGAIIKNSSGSKAGSVSRAKKQHTGAY
ncbi:MAG: amidohydrolase family protein [Cyanobacteriota/Melainabacteria group bacterium]